MAWYNILLLLAYAGTIISLVAVVLSENRNPVKSLAWITVLLMVPVFGVVLYIFFGRSLKNTRMITRRNRRRLRKKESFRSVDVSKLALSTASRQQIKMAKTITGSIYYPGNKVEIFTDGHSKFDALIADMESAKEYIHLQYYIFTDDNTGTRVAETLMRKAREGVKVRVIYDHIGSINTKSKFFRRMTEAGVAVYPFFRVTFPVFATRINWRNHRKIAIIDGKVGYIGGMNIADRYINGVAYGIWRDTHLRITGPAVGGLQYSFAIDWNFMGQPLLEESADTSIHNEPHFTAGIQMMTSGPTSTWSNIAMVFQKAIANAKRCVFLQTPYFLPTESLLRTLQAVALAKVDVRIMLPAKSDSAILTYASRSYIRECLLSGIKVYLYEGGMLHAKTVLVDDEFVSVGSTNFDFRSFEHNFESNVFIYSQEINRQMREIFLEDLTQCVRISPSEWNKRPRWQKIKESIFRLLSPVL
ncbi:cardiolipin synthase [Barnesiella sp. WM24]|uniref:cardiolipin synthase n=1 Tax=Barnesiella sp. WM24 TaxID=2558278 RepID=UPI001072C34A|nr:cardiolipin synthase [Barnesiella sp. WM24]TFU93767.1 cardiolipin synthase [Barnesiella sp. WM24]